ncbi:MAG: iron ABC transporter permease [Clostridiales bacterium]|jgi:iron complex transport system permease protein|nr:iron ABC transporter permease [Clostridiales bacterium]
MAKTWHKYGWLYLIVGFIFMAFVFVLSLCMGQYHLSFSEVINALFNGDNGETANNIIWKLRLPRLLSACFIGVALAVAGIIYQNTFQNELASPDIIGVSSGASVGIAWGILIGLPLIAISFLGFVLGVLAMGLTLFIARLFKNKSMTILIISGVLVSGFMGAVVSLIKSMADADTQLPNIVFWLLGSFASVTMEQTIIIMIVVSICVTFLYCISGKILNNIALGEEQARSKGVNYKLWRIIILGFATILTALSVSIAGVIGWVGLVIPHIARLLAGHTTQKSIPLAILFGGSFMMICDTLARTLTTSEIPVGAITGFFGIILFIAILTFKKGQKYGID